MKFELEPHNRGSSDAELIADLRRIAQRCGTESLTKSQYKEYGRYSAATIARRLGSWNSAIKKAGLVPALEQSVGQDALLADIYRVARGLGTERLRHADYKLRGKYSWGVVKRLFGTWDNAVIAAGLVPGWNTRITNEELFENIGAVWRHLGHQPRFRDTVSPLSRYSGDTYRNRFGGWRNALVAFVSAVNEKGAHHPTLDTRSAAPVALMPWDKCRHRTGRSPSWRIRFLTLRRDGFRCRACGRSPANEAGVQLHVDHIVAWSEGGETELGNLQTLCEKCNGGKSDLPFLDQ